MKHNLLTLLLLSCSTLLLPAQTFCDHPSEPWTDTSGQTIDAHGGCILYHGGTYYWYGEGRPCGGGISDGGVKVYASTDLDHWEPLGIALALSADAHSDITQGCIMERPKVVYNANTRKFVMLFHLELKGQGYAAARVGFAQSDTPQGPFTFIRSLRPNAGQWPREFTPEDIRRAQQAEAAVGQKWWTPQWYEAVRQGGFVQRDWKGGQMSRDMTIYIDTDGSAYHIYSSEENLTLHIAALTPDYLDYTGQYTRVAPGGMNEAPTIFKQCGRYWMITSGCTGWAPNEARMFSSPTIWGPWAQMPHPFRGPLAEKTFLGQGAYIFKPENSDTFIFMGDVWNPDCLRESRFFWLPIEFGEDGNPVIHWTGK